jgi:hypothetical protein
MHAGTSQRIEALQSTLSALNERVSAALSMHERGAASEGSESLRAPSNLSLSYSIPARTAATGSLYALKSPAVASGSVGLAELIGASTLLGRLGEAHSALAQRRAADAEAAARREAAAAAEAAALAKAAADVAAAAAASAPPMLPPFRRVAPRSPLRKAPSVRALERAITALQCAVRRQRAKRRVIKKRAEKIQQEAARDHDAKAAELREHLARASAWENRLEFEASQRAANFVLASATRVAPTLASGQSGAPGGSVRVAPSSESVSSWYKSPAILRLSEPSSAPVGALSKLHVQYAMESAQAEPKVRASLQQLARVEAVDRAPMHSTLRVIRDAGGHSNAPPEARALSAFILASPARSIITRRRNADAEVAVSRAPGAVGDIATMSGAEDRVAVRSRQKSAEWSADDAASCVGASDESFRYDATTARAQDAAERAAHVRRVGPVGAFVDSVLDAMCDAHGAAMDAPVPPSTILPPSFLSAPLKTGPAVAALEAAAAARAARSAAAVDTAMRAREAAESAARYAGGVVSAPVSPQTSPPHLLTDTGSPHAFSIPANSLSPDVDALSNLGDDADVGDSASVVAARLA